MLRALRYCALLAIALPAGASAEGKADPALTSTARNTGGAGDRLLSLADPEARIGSRLFFDTRFSQYFYAHSNGNVNTALSAGDPVVDLISISSDRTVPSPFRGQSMNCRQCHLGDDFIREQHLAGRTYCDFARRSTIPERSDGKATTVRNTPLMPDLGMPQDIPPLFHFDGEFSTLEDLVVGTMTGRNFGWLPSEATQAASHIAKVIREDTGLNPRDLVDSRGRGYAYRSLLLGTDPALPKTIRIPSQYRIDVLTASDGQILYAVARSIHAYMDSLRFGTNDTFRTSGAPYDLFLVKNHFPIALDRHESPAEYVRRLSIFVETRKSFTWITPADGSFLLHDQTYQFGPEELQGLRIFLTRDKSGGAHAGNCSTCHTPPRFTDHRFHNTGASQIEYDALFGQGAFSELVIPDLQKRNAAFNEYLPPSAAHPNATGRFRSAPSPDKPGYTDLGVWSVLGNADIPRPQATLLQVLCAENERSLSKCTAKTLLPMVVAHFKTPSIRDLGQSYPYLHTGAMDTVEDVLKFYLKVSVLARSGAIRNASPELLDVRIDDTDLKPLALFLRSLNEDYH